MDITDSLAPTSDQLDAIELVAGPRTFTIDRVTANNAEQPINVHLVDFPRPWRPSKGMRRVLAACWGTDASQWPGRRVRLFFDPEVTFGRERPGGTRIAALSHIDKPQSVPMIVTRGKSTLYKVQPLPDETPAEVKARLGAEWKQADPERRAAIEAEVARLTGATPEPAAEPTTDDGAAS